MPANPANIALEMKDIRKSYPGVQALKGVNFVLKKGEVHALMGENGAGKSTLVKILGGVIPEYEGDILMDEKKMTFHSTRDASACGIAFIHQELSLVPYLSIAENIFLGKEDTKAFGIVDRKSINSKARELLKALDINLDPSESVSSLNIGLQQMVEIAKSLVIEPKILVMDEPTSALTPHEVKALFEVIRKLKNQGTSIIYISHKLDEVVQISDYITVLRDGRAVDEFPVKGLDMDKLIQSMIGRKLDEYYPPYTDNRSDEFILEARKFSVRNPDNPSSKLVKNISFRLKKGEILGIFGLMGAGCTELLSGIFGNYHGFTRGELAVGGDSTTIKSPSDAIRRGLAFVTEDRKVLGLVLPMTVGENISLPSLKEYCRRGMLIDSKKERASVSGIVERMKIAAEKQDVEVQYLSGGNQQKVVIGKWLMNSPRILFLDEPTRGIDVGAKAEIYKLIRELTGNGLGVVLVSSDPAEVMGMSDRIIVMHNGSFTGEFKKQEFNEEKLMKCAVLGGIYGEK